MIYYLDSDKDGFGNQSRSKKANNIPSNYVDNNSDCDDTDHNSNPNQKEFFEEKNLRGTFDYNCDGIEKKHYDHIYSGAAHDHRSGWKYASPGCGESATYISVQNGHPVEITQKQRCN